MIWNLGLSIIGKLESGSLEFAVCMHQPNQLADHQHFARMDLDVNTQSLVRNWHKVDGALFSWFSLYLQGQ